MRVCPQTASRDVPPFLWDRKTDKQTNMRPMVDISSKFEVSPLHRGLAPENQTIFIIYTSPICLLKPAKCFLGLTPINEECDSKRYPLEQKCDIMYRIVNMCNVWAEHEQHQARHSRPVLQKETRRNKVIDPQSLSTVFWTTQHNSWN